MLRGILAGSLTARASSDEVVLGPGDDAALWQPPAGMTVVLTQDALVEGVDFRREWITPHQLGRRALAVSLSDLAGMGARPSFCLVTLCAPPSTLLADVEALHGGIEEMAAAHSCPLVGGDLSAIDGPLVLDVVAGGVVEAGRALRRDAGRPGDALVVTGLLGRAAAGLRVLSGSGPESLGVANAVASGWRSAQLDPVPRLREGAELAGRGVRCGGDVSDGLLVDSGRTAAACGCAAELWRDALPVEPSLQTAFGDAWPHLALGGGEDFELLAAVAPDALDALMREWPADLAPLTIVGRLIDGSGVRLLDRERGTPLAPPPIASRHFGS